MRNIEQSIETLAQLRAVGMQVAVDDFGVGYSSLGQLKRLPASSMKIDRSFIMNVPGDASSGSITEAIIAMAKRLKLRVHRRGRGDARRSSTSCAPTTATRSRASSSRSPSPRSKPPRCSRRKPRAASHSNSLRSAK